MLQLDVLILIIAVGVAVAPFVLSVLPSLIGGGFWLLGLAVALYGVGVLFVKLHSGASRILSFVRARGGRGHIVAAADEQGVEVQLEPVPRETPEETFAQAQGEGEASAREASLKNERLAQVEKEQATARANPS